MYVYIITYEGHISQQGYKSLEDAQTFIKNRSGNPIQFTPYMFRDRTGGNYEIVEVKI